MLFNRERHTVVLTCQFRFPAFVNGHDGMLIEAAAGLLDDASPEERIRAGVEEETGYRIQHVEKVFEAFMSPGLVTEKLFFFIADYDTESRVGEGGGLKDDGEDIEVLELPLSKALQLIQEGVIVDRKTIMLLQHVALRLSR
ncbi:GDP-mannose pyrophosphatase [Halomonas sp. McH1-25]|nr:GDP-mannose pyrophosphatase [Halomonas sp. McH1-25]MCP1341376.1 GDP-mannose pyrophosphatase [Halomonas sp. FL8]MCP1359679.1 GDP-mannose pyrophosphatase [Halomonas sp. BBD45]MCP1365324.1 GDP-mannose pyrophosphatase [Halomonas sp. BBD48]